jgi:hypothetical protein
VRRGAADGPLGSGGADALGRRSGRPRDDARQANGRGLQHGMVLDGWCSAYAATGDDGILAAAARADFCRGPGR